MPNLTSNSYGKSRSPADKSHPQRSAARPIEYAVDIRLDGDFAGSYLDGDNSKIVATDSMKNTVYVLAKERDFSSPEEFAMILVEHFVKTYPQVSASSVTVRQSAWNRVPVDGKPHDHAFVSGGAELHIASAKASRDQKTTISGGVADLLVLKTTRSAFKGFVMDRYRTLKDADDRIFATSVTATWDFSTAPEDFASAFDRIRDAILTIFAAQMSFAVQQTMFAMGQAALAAVPEITRIALRLPNKHRIPVNLDPFGLENKNEIFVLD